MKKFKVAVIAIFDGLLVVAAMAGVILGLIHSFTTGAEYALFMLSPVPVVWIHTRLSRICDKLNGID